MAEQIASTPVLPARLHVIIVTGERAVYDGPADRLLAPAAQGMITVLPHHAALLTMLEPGELTVRSDGAEQSYAVGGGFLEVRDDEVIILGDSVERADEIDVGRAEAARQRAAALIRATRGRPEAAVGLQALRRSRARLRVARRAGRR